MQNNEQKIVGKEVSGKEIVDFIRQFGILAFVGVTT